MEAVLGILLVIAVIYILYLERQPRTDKEIQKDHDRKARMAETRAAQAAKKSGQPEVTDSQWQEYLERPMITRSKINREE